MGAARLLQARHAAVATDVRNVPHLSKSRPSGATLGRTLVITLLVASVVWAGARLSPPEPAFHPTTTGSTGPAPSASAAPGSSAPWPPEGANQAPTACFAHSTAPGTIHVNASCSIDPGGTVSVYEWNWGDGSILRSGDLASHTYNSGGTRTVTLIVTTSAGATTQASQTITVSEPPSQPPTACFVHAEAWLATRVDASCSTDGDGTVSTFAWSWGDGTVVAAGRTAGHAYAASGTRTLTLIVTDESGATGATTQLVTVTSNQPPAACFVHAETWLATTVDAACSMDPDGTVASYAWTWGDASPAGSGTTAGHTYASAGARTLTLLVTDESGLTGAVSQIVTVTTNLSPTACFTHSETMLTLSVDAACSTDPDGTVASFAWSWGDGPVLETGRTSSHSYAAAGARTVTLIVTDNVGATHAASQIVTVVANQPAGACFAHVEVFLTTTVDGDCAVDADGTVTAFSWNWGDGSALGSGVAATHTYVDAGTFNVELRVTDNSGGTGTVIQSVTVTADQPPTPCFVHAEAYLVVTVDASCSTDSDGTIASYSWNWGDGLVLGSGLTATHTYASSGTRTVTLLATDDVGVAASANQFVTVTANQPPTACFTHSEIGLTTSVAATCSADPDGTVTSISWNWGDGSGPGTGNTLSHTYSSGGTRSVTLVVADDTGATSAATQLVTVTAPAANAQTTVNLRSAAAFAVLAATTVTSAGVSAVQGDLGVSPGTAVTGFPPGTIAGTLYGGGAVAAQAAADLATAYDDAAARANAPVAISGNLGGQTLIPGLYRSASTLEVTTGDLILDGKGDPNAVFVIQMSTTLTMGAGRQVVLVGQAQSDNVYWQVGSSATIGANAVLKGNVLVYQSVTMGAGADLDGRLLARVGAITLDTNTISIPS